MRFFTNFLRAGGHWLLGAATLLGPVDALAQTPRGEMGCGFDLVQQAAFARQPGAEATYRQFLTQAARLAAQPGARGTLGAAPDITVPVVVHILFGSQANNTNLFNPIISDAQVNDALRIANLDYSKSNADTLAVIPAFQGRIANVGFRFRLAKIDPNGNCTTGITRNFSRGATSIGPPYVTASEDLLLKQETRWDPSRYLNIWVVDQFASGGGYAYLPCADATVDGIVIDNRYFGSIGTALGTNVAARVLTHELGHYFGLLHTFGLSNSPGLATNCGLDDGVADTPPTVGTSSCDLAFTSCPDPQTNQPVLANVQNYMDYGSCSNMFTVGQRAVMRAALTLGCRGPLVSAANLVATGTNDGYQLPAGGCPAPPLAGISVDIRQMCAAPVNSIGQRVFTGWGTTDALNAPTAQVQWSFPGGVPATATGRSIRVNYSTPGVYPVTVTITPAGGGPPVSRTEPNFMLVRGPGTGLSGAVNESFENPAFPNSFGAADLRNWLLVNENAFPFAFRWQRASGGGLVAADGTACLVVPNSLVPPPPGTYSYSVIVSPALDLSALKGPGRAARLSFRTARATHPNVPGSLQDELLVQYGTDCGVSSNGSGQRYDISSLQVPGQTAQSGFVPTSAQQWTTITLPLDPRYIGPATWVRFTFQTKGGNPFYLDRVRIEDPNAPLATRDETLARDAFAVYPNPATGELRLRYPAPGPAPTGLRLYDALGRPVRAFATPGPDGALSLRGLAAGVYVLRGELAGQPVSRRVTVE